MYYAGYRVLPEAPLREDWVQVINAIFNKTRIVAIRMVIIIAIQILISFCVHIVDFLPIATSSYGWSACSDLNAC